MDRALVNAPETNRGSVESSYRRLRTRPAAFFFAASLAMALFVSGIGSSRADADDGDASRMTAAWDAVYQAKGVQVEPGKPVPAVMTSRRGTRWDSFLDYVTASMGSDYVYNWVDFSGKPTISFIPKSGPRSDPAVFEPNDQKFNWYGSVGTIGAGHSRVNTYLSGVYRRDLDDQAIGSPFQNILNGYSGGDKGNLQNGWAEMNGLAESGFFSKTSARLGRVFVPYSFPGVIGSPAIDGGRLSYDDTRNEANAFVGRWEPFYDGVSSEVVVAGGSYARQLFPKWGPSAGVSPFAQFLYFDDTGGDSNIKHIYGFRSWYETFTLDGFFTWVKGHPVDVGAQSSFSTGKVNMYGKIQKKLTTDDYNYDVFYTTDDIKDRHRLNIGSLQKWLDVTFDMDYQACKWLSVGSGIWARALDHESDQGPYENSFTDVNGRILITPRRDLNAGVQYHFRDVRRRSPKSATTFDDIQTAGETIYHGVNGDIRYRWEMWRFNVGGYLGIYDTQDRLTKIDDTTVAGGYVQTKAYLTDNFAMRFMFIVDRGNDQFTPDIDTQFSFRSGFEYYY